MASLPDRVITACQLFASSQCPSLPALNPALQPFLPLLLSLLSAGKWVLATTKNYLMVLKTSYRDPKSGKELCGFTNRMGANAPAPRLLRLKTGGWVGAAVEVGADVQLVAAPQSELLNRPALACPELPACLHPTHTPTPHPACPVSPGTPAVQRM